MSLSDTTASLKVYGGIAVTAVNVNSVVIILLIYHFYTTDIHYHALKIFAILPTSISFLTSIISSVFLTNILLPSIHDKYKLIDEYCQFMWYIQFSLEHIAVLTRWIFYLCRIKYFFKSTPFQLSTINFVVHIMMYILLRILIGGIIINDADFLIYHATNNDRYKLCYISYAVKAAGYIICIIITESIIHIELLYLLYIKTKQSELDQADTDELSIHFSQRNDTDLNLINTKIMRRCVISGIIELITAYSGGIIYVMLGIEIKHLYNLSVIASAISILCSFDISGCSDVDDQNAEQMVEVEDMSRTQMYLSTMMNHFYDVPQRSNLQTRKNITNTQ